MPPRRNKPDLKKTLQRVVIVVLVLLIVGTVLGSYYNVSEQENAVASVATTAARAIPTWSISVV